VCIIKNITHLAFTEKLCSTIYVISPTVAPAVPETCCFSFIDFQIPTPKIVSVLKTNSHCPSPGIVVTTARTEFCVDPAEAWIKSFMEK
uniref:Chemokine interleukin-8-like domain-containing protein n=1 Tax=Cyprinus carpio TaxID=7962 RepID=A0A8C2C5P2_CYPCA